MTLEKKSHGFKPGDLGAINPCERIFPQICHLTTFGPIEQYGVWHHLAENSVFCIQQSSKPLARKKF
jgi:hypothetical protein